MNTWKDILDEVVGTSGTNNELAHAFCWAHVTVIFKGTF